MATNVQVYNTAISTTSCPSQSSTTTLTSTSPTASLRTLCNNPHNSNSSKCSHCSSQIENHSSQRGSDDSCNNNNIRSDSSNNFSICNINCNSADNITFSSTSNLALFPRIGLPSSPYLGRSNLHHLPNLRSRTPEPLRNACKEYPGDIKPNDIILLKGHERISDPINKSFTSTLSSPLISSSSSSTSISFTSNPNTVTTTNKHKWRLPSRCLRSNSITSSASIKSSPTFKETVHISPLCSVDHWIGESWQPLIQDSCIVEVRVTTSMVGCWVILLQKNNKLVLNSWIYLYTTIHRDSPTQVSISCNTDQHKEYYRINCPNEVDAEQFFQNLIRVRKLLMQKKPNVPTQEFLISRSSSLHNNEQGLVSRTFSLQQKGFQKFFKSPKNLIIKNGGGGEGEGKSRTPPLSLAHNEVIIIKESEQKFRLLIECKVKIFLQRDHGMWSSLGWGNMKLMMELPFRQIRINIENEKQVALIDAMVSPDGTERINKTNIAMTLDNFGSGLKNIYMMQLKDEPTAVKTYKIMKNKK